MTQIKKILKVYTLKRYQLYLEKLKTANPKEYAKVKPYAFFKTLEKETTADDIKEWELNQLQALPAVEE